MRSLISSGRSPGSGELIVSADAIARWWPSLDPIHLVSFDLFDTLIVRAEPAEGAVDLAVARHLAASGVEPAAYAAARLSAGTSAAEGAPGRAPSLEAIMSTVGATLGWDQSLIQQAVRHEKAIDLAGLSAVPGASALLVALRERGCRIAFLSDMHLGAADLAPVLTRLKLLSADDLLLVSCDEGASKAHQGELYQRLIAQTNCPASRMLHVGNHPWADDTMARGRGLESLLVRTAELSRYESNLVAPHADARRDLGSSLAGQARLARLHALAHGDEPPLASVASGVAAPTMIGFTTWLATRAEALELDRLVFLSRNGRLPYEVYRRLPHDLTHDRPASYVTLSRNAVRMASAAVDLDAWIACGHDTSSSFLRQHTDLLPIRQLLSKLHLDPDEVGEGFERNGFPLDQPVGADRSDADWRARFDDAEFRAALLRQAEAERSLLVDYLDQHGLLADERIGVVDIGWRGQQAAMMTAVAESASEVHLHHFHLGRDQAESLLHPVRIERYLFDHEDRPVVDNAVALFETLAATTEPGMTGLRRTNGTVEPVFRPDHDPVRESPHIDPLHRIVIDVTERLADRLEPHHGTDDVRARIIENAQAFWLDPSDDEAAYWTSLPFERDASGRAIATLGSPIRRADLVPILTRSWTGRQWVAGSISISHPATRGIISAAYRRRTQSRS